MGWWPRVRPSGHAGPVSRRGRAHRGIGFTHSITDAGVGFVTSFATFVVTRVKIGSRLLNSIIPTSKKGVPPVALRASRPANRRVIDGFPLLDAAGLTKLTASARIDDRRPRSAQKKLAARSIPHASRV